MLHLIGITIKKFLMEGIQVVQVACTMYNRGDKGLFYFVSIIDSVTLLFLSSLKYINKGHNLII